MKKVLTAIAAAFLTATSMSGCLEEDKPKQQPVMAVKQVKQKLPALVAKLGKLSRETGRYELGTSLLVGKDKEVSISYSPEIPAKDLFGKSVKGSLLITVHEKSTKNLRIYFDEFADGEIDFVTNQDYERATMWYGVLRGTTPDKLYRENLILVPQMRLLYQNDYRTLYRDLVSVLMGIDSNPKEKAKLKLIQENIQ